MCFSMVFRKLAPLGMLLFALSQVSADEISFNRDIKSLLSENCFACHGPDKEKVAGGFRLDQRESAIQEADSGEKPIVPHDGDASEVMVRLETEDESLRMPPPESGKSLTPSQIKKIRQWIDQGAPYDQHWAFVAPVRPAVPGTNDPTAQNAIDHFVFDRLKREGLSPQKPAERATLLRRVSLDLIGLPPTPEEAEAFLNDASPMAYERVVDRLLASPHYGERMAIPWLDYARYADSNGFQSDGSREMWAWRDWVINAYNNNLPFDQFTIEQIAGDMLPDATNEQKIATGFNRNHRLNGEGGRIVDEWFIETVIDRVETTGLTWLGLTFNCCRCHDHKYDPISQREFYQLFAYFNSNEESGVLAPNGKNGDNTPPVLELPTEEQQKELSRLEAVQKEIERRLADAKTAIPKSIADWEASRVRKNEDAVKRELWEIANPSSVKSLGGATFTRLEDDSYLASGENPASDTYEVTIPLQAVPIQAALSKGDSAAQARFTGFVIEVLPDSSLPNKSLGRASNGNFVLSRVDATASSPSQKTPLEIAFHSVSADFSQPGWPAESVQRRTNESLTADKMPKKGWAAEANKPENRVPRRITFVADRAYEFKEDAVLKITMKHESPFSQHNIGRFRIYTSARPIENLSLEAVPIPSSITEILAIASRKRNKKQQSELQSYFLSHVPNPIQAIVGELEKAKKNYVDLGKTILSTMVMKEGKPREAFILERGEYDKPTVKVERQLPAVLPRLPEGASNDRLGFAKWIVDTKNPLTARVWVNRQWELFFGTGIVKTSENFGVQAEFPSHPELLDWMASEFMSPTVMPSVNGVKARPWDMKAFHKMIVMSGTYRQSSVAPQKSLSLDPENRLVSRGPRFRLSGELIRDTALHASGLLVSNIGGPSARPYMPKGVWDETSKYGNLRNYKHDSGDGLYRRTMYTIWKRTAAPPSMLLFDAPNREVCTIKRSRTNTPLQALSLLNEVTFVEASRGLAIRMLSEAGETAEDRIAHGFRLAMGRQPSEAEMQILVKGLEADLQHFANAQSDAEKLVSVGEFKSDKKFEAPLLAAYILTANVLFNLDEFVTRE